MHSGRIVVAIFALAIGCTGCSSGSAGPAPRDLIDETASTAKVELRDITSTLVLPGKVIANPDYLISSSTDGKISFDASATAGRTLEADATFATVNGVAVRVRAASDILELLQRNGGMVAANVPIAKARYVGFGVMVQVPEDQIFRLYATPTNAKVNVASGPSGVECLLQPVAATDVLVDGSAGVGFICLLPIGTQVVAGLDAKIGLQTGVKESVPALPLQAVSGSTKNGEVSKVVGGSATKVSVVLGITDGSFIEIVEGLKLGDMVLNYAPGLD